MKRTFVDLHLRVNGNDFSQNMKFFKKMFDLGYKLVAVSFRTDTRFEELHKLKSQCAEVGLDFASRVDLRPKSPDELLSLLRRLRRRFEVVCVCCENKEVARQAAKDRRVDLLNFPLLDYRRRFFDRAEAELARTGCAAFEVDIKPLLILDGPARIRLLSCLRREVIVAREFRVPIVISSGVSEVLLLRKPREMSILSSLFGLEDSDALNAVSKIPFDIVYRNREKLGAQFVAPGIRVLKQGEDC